MRVMTSEEMRTVVEKCNWATICTVDPAGRPYAVEATPYTDGGDTCVMITPRGGTWRGLEHAPHVLLKYTLTSRDLRWWAGVSGHGTGRFDPDPEAIRRGFELLGKVMGADYSRAGEHHAARAGRSPLLRVIVREYTGRCSAGADAALFARQSRPEDRE